ncbi:MAG TPA: M1 family metallopeptidase [Chitinophagaceae bacterium]
MDWKFFFAILFLLPSLAQAQQKSTFSKADSLRGSLNENRDWWDVLRYDLEVTPDYRSKSITGKTRISFTVTKRGTNRMQIDLQKPLVVDSVYLSVPGGDENKVIRKITFDRKQELNVFYCDLQLPDNEKTADLVVYYHGVPIEAKNAPWDGGWIWSSDSLGRPWMSVAVQGLGASAWYPCKDYQGDEPDNGASLTILVPDTLVAVGNGRLVQRSAFPETHMASYRWEVKNPINNYTIIPSIGKYVNWTDTLNGEQGVLDLSYWVLDYNLERSKYQFQQAKQMLRCFEYWFGPYPFYEDSYKLVDAPFLGMEHQSAVAYGNHYRNGYRGKDLSGTGWGSKWDFIIVHESGHEWFANNITTRDIADMWVHEGFTNYSETLYTEWLFGKQAGDEYNFGIRRNIKNDRPIIGPYGVNRSGSGDMYYKAGNMIHTIRKAIDDDEKFRQLLRGLNETFRHRVVATEDIERYITRKSGIDFSKTFDQYLRTTQVPKLEYRLSKKNNRLEYRWTNCVKGFNLPLVLNGKRYQVTTQWKRCSCCSADLQAWSAAQIEKLYYINAKQVSKP